MPRFVHCAQDCAAREGDGSGKKWLLMRDSFNNMAYSLKSSISIFFLAALFTIARGSDLASSLTTTQAVDFMKSADSAWIFTVDAIGSRDPAQELSKTARRQFVALISDPGNFGKPMGMPIGPPSVGIEFQKGARKLTIYTNWQFGCFYDNFQRINFLAVLDGKTLQLAQAWQKKYFPRPTSSLHPASGY